MAGPADGIAPVCTVALVSTLYASGPPRPAITASGTGADASSRRKPPRDGRSARKARTSPAAATPTTRMSSRSQGNHLGLPSSRNQAQTAVPARPTARAAQANQVYRVRQSWTDPMPTSAPIAGARAMV